VVHLHVAGTGGQLLRDFLDDLVARVRHRVYRVSEADDDLLVFHAATDVGFGFVGVGVALLDLEGHFVGTAVLGPAQRTYATGYGRVDIRSRAGNDAAGKGRGIEFVLGIQVERGVHGAYPLLAGRRSV